MDPTRTSEAPQIGFLAVVGWTTVIWTAWIGSSLIGAWVAKAFAAPPWLELLAKGIAPAIIAIVATIGIQTKLGGTWRDVGLRRTDRRSLVVGLIAALPLLIAYGVLFGVMGVETTTVPLLGLVITKFVVAQGIAEEVIFRGFVFARLRAGRSFLRAATLSAVVFSLVHLSNFLHGFSTEVIIGAIASTLFGFVLAYPSALLFERSGNAIWPFAITHVLIDSLNWFEKVSVPGPSLYVYLSAVLLTAGWTVALGVRLMSKRSPTASESLSTA